MDFRKLFYSVNYRVSKILLLNGDSLKVCTVSITNSIKLSIVNFY
ncbi:hypothetical protein LEP1GSC045_3884 [Leptospira interrogans serovar Pomona str. Kennewicki LC82-25]|nr:hypothetical protein LEP1GSC045_3884 [Leptospira interrogans serovar Pomona str. Kennewicki LC82-25]